MSASVEIENLRKVFILKSGWGRGRVEKEIVAVDQISLSIPAGQSVAFIGMAVATSSACAGTWPPPTVTPFLV